MIAEQQLKKEIKERIEHISAEHLSDVLDFIKNIEAPEIDEILSYAGILEDLDPDVLDDLTTHLHERRISQSRQML